MKIATSLPPGPAIPRQLWQTHRTRKLTEEGLGCRDVWLERAAGWAWRMMDDAECRDFVHGVYGGEVAAVFDAFPLGVMRADFWRVLVLHAHGGLYADTDTQPVVPPSEWLREDDVFVCSAEVDGIHLCNWTFAAAAGHPALESIIELIVQRAREGIDTSYEHFVHKHTGPGVFRDGVRAWLGCPEATIADLVAMSNAGALPKGARILDHDAFDGRLVRHLFASTTWPDDYASWRKEREAVSRS